MPCLNDPCANILGTPVNAVDIPTAIDMLDQLLARGCRGYVCVTGVHGITEAQYDATFQSALKNSALTVPDGMPIVWVGRIQGFRTIKRVYGPDLMVEFCRKSTSRNYRHFLYGGKEGVAEELAVNLRKLCPGLNIVGCYTPPFRRLNSTEERELISLFARCNPDVTWVGISTPKQEKFMAEYLSKLDTRLMVGVGAAFDIHTGRLRDAPDWIKAAGLQWLHRLVQEPKRLWKRYLINNPKFVVRIGFQLLKFTKYEL